MMPLNNSRRPDDRRPAPEDLLTLAYAEERNNREGKLIVYLGYAAGVGKTYTMLWDALQLRAEGKEVVIGYVETHKRVETEALAARLEAIPPARIWYQGLAIREMDLDAVIARTPAIILVDELAHTNAPNSRHLKRYQDIEELLRAGISVYTTVNIQHIDSLNDAISQITGIQVSETVPDTFFDLADDVRLIDLTPEELQARRPSSISFRPGTLLLSASWPCGTWRNALTGRWSPICGHGPYRGHGLRSSGFSWPYGPAPLRKQWSGQHTGIR
jgi:two-component system sensor histidine kinase KdpD